MDFLQILKIIAALGTIGTGVFALFWPRRVQGFTGLQVQGGRGVTEIRAVMGGFFIALGAAPLLLGAAAFQMLGIAYLGVGLARLVSIFYDHSAEPSNWISLGVELVFGLILVL